MWPWKNFLIPLGAALSLAAAVIPTLYGVAWWAVILTVLAVGSLVAVKAGDRVHIASVFKDLNSKQKDRVATLVRIAVGAHILWAMVYVVSSDWRIYLLAGLPILSLSVYGCARNEEYHIAHAKPEAKSVEGGPFEDRTEVKKARALLDEAGHPRVRILEFKRIGEPDKGTGGQQIVVQIPTTGMGK